MERPRHRLAPMLVVLLLGLVGGAATAKGADAQAACEPTNLATQIALFCAPDMPTGPCCEPVVASVDLGGGVPCLCRVAAQPQLVLARLNASHLLALYTACGGLRTGGAHLAAACQSPSPPAIPVVDRPPPVAPRHKLPSRDAPPPPATAQLSPPPQQQPGGASQGMTIPTQPANRGTSPPASPVVAPPLAFGPRRKLLSRDVPPPPATAQVTPLLLRRQPDGASQGKSTPSFQVPTTPGLQGPSTSAASISAPPHPVAPRHNGSAISMTALARERQDTIGRVFGCIGDFISLILFWSPAITFCNIYRNHDVEGYSPDTYLATFLSCALGALYASPLVRSRWVVVVVNLLGIFSEMVYLYVYWKYASESQRKKVRNIVIGELLFLTLVASITVCVRNNTRIWFTGGLCAVVGCIMYLAQVPVAWEAWRTQSVVYLPLPLTLASLANAICWGTYACMQQDYYVMIPNSTGVVVGFSMLVLYCIVYFKKADGPASSSGAASSEASEVVQ